MKEPDIFSYHEHLEFLRDWLAYRKASQPGFSLRALASSSGISAAYLPLVLAGKRTLTLKALVKISPHLGLSRPQRSYLEALVILGTSDSQAARVEALDKMKRFRSYQKAHPQELETYQYLTHWYHVAIREMAALPGFEATPEWIQPRLKGNVSLAEIKSAIEFLKEHQYLTKDSQGSWQMPEKSLECVGGVYRVALTQFHHEVLELAARSITETPSSERSIQGHTMTLHHDQLPEARAILDGAIQRLRELATTSKKSDAVYHVELALFPLSQVPSPTSPTGNRSES